MLASLRGTRKIQELQYQHHKQKDVPPYFANSFLASLQTVTHRVHFESLTDTFAWVDAPDDRALCQTLFHNILVALKVLNMARAG